VSGKRDPLGDSQGADRDTLVLWIQSRDSGIYVDLHPLGSPGRSCEAARSAGNSSSSERSGRYSMGQQDKLIDAKSLFAVLASLHKIRWK
jgi:hypothetical protein